VGEIFVDLPVTYGGNDIKGIYLRFEGGRIVEYDAAVGRDHLAAIIETDEGSHRLGEVALGMNPGLDRVLKHPLFVEKVAVPSNRDRSELRRQLRRGPPLGGGRRADQGARALRRAQPLGAAHRHRHRLPPRRLRPASARGWGRAAAGRMECGGGSLSWSGHAAVGSRAARPAGGLPPGPPGGHHEREENVSAPHGAAGVAAAAADGRDRAAAILQELRKGVLGQNTALRFVSVAIYKHTTGKVSGNILLIGNSGTGKTTIMNNIQRMYHDVPEYRPFGR